MHVVTPIAFVSFWLFFNNLSFVYPLHELIRGRSQGWNEVAILELSPVLMDNAMQITEKN